MMLDRFFGEDKASSSTHLKTIETRINLKIVTGAEAATLQSLQVVRPSRIFHSGRAAMNNDLNKARLHMLPDQPFHLESRRRRCQKLHCEEDEYSSQRDLERYHIHVSWGSRDASSSHGRNAEFDKYSNIPDYVMCLGGHDVQKLHVFSKFTVEQRWCLTMQIFEQILADLYAPKDGVLDAMTLDNLWSVCTHTL